MIPEIEISSFARALVKSYGREASGRCARNRQKLLADGDVDGYVIWCRVGQSVEALLKRRALQGED